MSPTTKAYLAPFCTQTRTQAAGAIPPSVCLAPHMASLTFPVKVWVLPAATPGTTANPVLSTTVAIQICNIRKRDINNPPVFRSCYWMRPYRNIDSFVDRGNAQHRGSGGKNCSDRNLQHSQTRHK